MARILQYSSTMFQRIHWLFEIIWEHWTSDVFKKGQHSNQMIGKTYYLFIYDT